MNHVVEFLARKNTRQVFLHPDVFTLRKDRKHLWLQRLCIWLLRKLDCRWAQDTEVVSVVHFDTENFVEAIIKQRNSLMDFYHHRGTKLLIGPEEFQELMGIDTQYQHFAFSAEYRYGKTYRGLEVEVIPWMRGILVMP